MTLNGGDLDALVDRDIRRGADSADEIIGHSRPEPLANQQMNRAIAAAIGEEHRRLSGGISRADDGDVLRVVKNRFDGGAGVVNAGRFESLGAFGVELSPAHAGRDQDRAGAKGRAAVEVQDVVIARRAGPGRCCWTMTGATIFAPNLSICRTLRVASSAPDRPLGKPMKFSILDDPRSLAAGAESIEHDGGDALGGGVNGGGHSGRSGADDREIDRIDRAVPPDAGAFGEFAQIGIDQQLTRRRIRSRGIFSAIPSWPSAFVPARRPMSYQVNGTKFLKRNSRTSMVSRHLPGPTTFSPRTPPWKGAAGAPEWRSAAFR